MQEPLSTVPPDRSSSDAPPSGIAGWIERWRNLGLINSQTADALHSDVAQAGELPARADRPHGLAVFTPAMALVVVGGILVVCAVVLVVAQFWEDLGPVGRFATVGMPMLALYAAAIALRRTGRAEQWLSDGFALIGACLAPFAAWLALGMARSMPEADSPEGAGWMALATGIGLLVQLITARAFRGAALTLPPSASLLWLAVALPSAFMPDRYSGYATSWSIAGAGLLLMAAGQVLIAAGLSRHAIAPNLLGVVGFLMGVSVVAAEYEGAAYLVAIAVPLALVLFASNARLRLYLWPAAVFLVFNIFHAGFAQFEESAGLPITLLGCGLASLAVGYLVHRVRKDAVTETRDRTA